MALKPSRRIPKRFQRPPSALSRHHASRLERRRSQSALHTRLSLFFRRARRSERSFRDFARRFRFLVLFGAVGMCVALILLVFFSSLFSVSSMSVRRQDQRLDIEEIERLLLPYFGRHLLFLPSGEVERMVSSAYPEAKEVIIEKHFPHELRLTITMKDIGSEVLLGNPDDTEEEMSTASGNTLHRYLTTDGIYLEYPILLSSSSAIDPRDRTVLHLVDWVVKPVHRQALLSPEVLHEITSTIRILRESFGHTVQFVTLYLRAKEFHVRTERLTLWFDFASPTAAQLDRYRAFLRALPIDQSEKYVDLRLHDRVVYR